MLLILTLWAWIVLMAKPGTYRKEYPKGGHGYYMDGAKADGVTNIINKGTPKTGLINWAAGMAAEFAVDHPAAYVDLTRDEAVDLIAGAHNRNRDAAARRGTEVHRIAQRLMAGEEVEVDDVIEGHVDSYIKFCEDWQPGADTLIERTVVNRKHGYMGTWDAVGTLRGMPGPGLYDIKTTRSGIFGDIALQLAAYRYATSMLDGRLEVDMPEIHWCAALWVRADGYDLIPVTAGPDEFRAFLYVQQVAKFYDRCNDLVGGSLYPDEVEESA